jgi:hypothetical protein
MSELRTRFDADEIAAHAVQPDFAKLEARAARRVRNRRRALSVAATVAVVLVALGTPSALRLLAVPGPGSLGGADGDRTDRVQGEADPPQRAAPPAETPELEPRVQFLDLRTGFLIERLVAGGQRCGPAVRVTADGGTTWSEPRMPDALRCGAPDPPVRGPRVRVVNASTVVVLGDGVGFVSHDAGRRWTTYHPRTRTVDELPAGVLPRPVCLRLAQCRTDNRLEAVDPASGDLLRLRAGPGFGALREVVEATDGSWWVPGQADDGRYGVAWSRDRGRTWTTRLFDFSGEDSEGPTIATLDGRSVHVTVVDVRNASGGTQVVTVAFFRSADGGTSWDRVTPDALPTDRLGQFGAYVARDGSLLLEAGERGWFASRDGGLRFAPAPGVPATTDVYRVRDGYACFDAGQRAAYVSDDGLAWRRVPLP